MLELGERGGKVGGVFGSSFVDWENIFFSLKIGYTFNAQ